MKGGKQKRGETEQKVGYRVRESDDACLLLSAAMHSGRGHFLYVLTPATPALLTWSGPPAPPKAASLSGLAH